MGYGKAADWWSVGVMIYEMLAGTPPFRGPDLRQTYQNVLFADLKFTPEEKFSEPATVLLRGMIQRDPSLRLGAWSNPPTDIMESAFFAGIDWAAVMEKRSDGPHIPAEDPLLASRRKKEEAAAKQEQDDDESNLEGWEEDCGAAVPLGAAAGRAARQPSKPISEVSGMDQSELLHIRESIFDASGVQNANKIQDWSFVDAATLGPTIAAGNAAAGKNKKNSSNLKKL
jgi:serine/threonine protein kinase